MNWRGKPAGGPVGRVRGKISGVHTGGGRGERRSRSLVPDGVAARAGRAALHRAAGERVTHAERRYDETRGGQRRAADLRPHSANHSRPHHARLDDVDIRLDHRLAS